MMSITLQPFKKKFPRTETVDPVERYVPLTLKLLVYLFCAYFFYEAATTFIEYRPGQHWPFLFSTFRMFTFLPIHEAGHLIFKFFGTTLMFLGGSFWQIVFPLLWFLIALKQRSHVAPFPLFWVGENMMDVSLYIRDAQFRVLPLLGGHTSYHDWYNLLSRWNVLDSAGVFADIFYLGGCVIAVSGIAAGVYLAFSVFFKSPTIVPITPVKSSQSDLSVEDLLDSSLGKNNHKDSI